jgi:hypothetical protein
MTKTEIRKVLEFMVALLETNHDYEDCKVESCGICQILDRAKARLTSGELDEAGGRPCFSTRV